VLTTCTAVPVGRALRRRVLVEDLQDALLKVIHASQTKTNAAEAHASTGMGAFIARSHMNILQNANHQVAYVLTICSVAMAISALRRRAHAEDTQDALLKVIHASQAKTHAAVAHASMGMGASFAKLIDEKSNVACLPGSTKAMLARICVASFGAWSSVTLLA